MVNSNSGKKFRTYDVRKKEIHPSQLKRKHPTMEGISAQRKKKIETFGGQYIRFLNKIQIAPDAIREVSNIVSSNCDLKIINEDRTAFGLVKFGEIPIEKGIRVLYSHTDSPCLRAKPNPLCFEWDPDLRDLHTGVELDTFGYGGIFPHQYTGRSLNAVGWAYIGEKRIELNFPVYSPEVCAHTDIRAENNTEFNEAHSQESIDLVTGYPSSDDFLKFLKFKDKVNFNRSALFLVPIVTARKNGPYYITGRGQDDLIGVFSSTRAFLDSKSSYTTILMGFDKEEIGSQGSGGAQSKFFERVFNETVRLKSGKTLEQITTASKEDIFAKSLAINADVDVAATGKEIVRDLTYIDFKNVSKLGYGSFFLCSDGTYEDQISPRLADYVLESFKKNSIYFQPIGSPVSVDYMDSVATMNCFFRDRGFNTINVCVPVASLHSPEELSHIGDLYATYEAYKSLLNEEKPIPANL